VSAAAVLVSISDSPVSLGDDLTRSAHRQLRLPAERPYVGRGIGWVARPLLWHERRDKKWQPLQTFDRGHVGDAWRLVAQHTQAVEAAAPARDEVVVNTGFVVIDRQVHGRGPRGRYRNVEVGIENAGHAGHKVFVTHSEAKAADAAFRGI